MIKLRVWRAATYSIFESLSYCVNSRNKIKVFISSNTFHTIRLVELWRWWGVFKMPVAGKYFGKEDSIITHNGILCFILEWFIRIQNNKY